MATTARRRRANPGEGERLRAELLTAAEALLVAAGDERALTLRAVAARAGVTTPSVYLHFADRDELVGAVCLRVWQDLGERMRQAAAEVTDPFQRLRRYGAAYVRFGIDHPVQYRALMMRQPRPGQQRPERAAADACFAYLCECVAPCVQAGVLRGDPQRLALRMWSAVHGCVALQLAHPDFPWPADLDGLADEVARMAGLGSAVLDRLPGPASATLPASAFVSVLDELPDRLAANPR